MPFSYFTYYSAILYSSYNCHIVSTHSENNLLLSIIYRCIKATQSNDVFMLFFRNTVCIFYHFRMGTDHSDILSSLHVSLVLSVWNHLCLFKVSFHSLLESSTIVRYAMKQQVIYACKTSWNILYCYSVLRKFVRNINILKI